ncbi:M67 family metallopeptidase [Pyxidicoccus parkwayensis]|uniref:M67 family metallopeptidase n=1 Tax=Pyxidicoccus parkwayensis TaxID=2813578 RepID=A0ABX7P5F0_9BACT|nr:M67 family metallopeptidase [Pyxidicoccus parkwaysis]QSQ25714.1 M67 family metallopeptidase [Pyxidicoccus parkwaysis]
MIRWPEPGWPQGVRDAVVRHLEASYPHEGCGVVLRARDEGAWRVRPLRNVSISPRTAYAFAPEEWLAVSLEADARGERVVCVFHSHVEAPATFSLEDSLRAAPEGLPLLPGVSYLIGSVHRGCVTCVSEYEWEGGVFRLREA